MSAPPAGVLIVEDFAPLRDAFRTALEGPRRVTLAATTEEARALLAAGPAPAVVLLDWSTGESAALAREIASLRPAPFVIAISGDPARVAEAERTQGVHRAVPKMTLNLASLAALVAEAERDHAALSGDPPAGDR